MTKPKQRINRPRRQRAKSQGNKELLLRSRQDIETARQQRVRKSEGPSLEALAGAAIAGPIGYLAVEGIMNDNQHPIHWLITGIIGIVGYIIGAGVYRWRESH